MNRFSFTLAVGAAYAASFVGVALHAAPDPLPSGPLLNPNGDFSAWKISYSYTSDTDKTAKAAPPVPPSPTLPGSMSLLPLRSLTITWTSPMWHSVAVDTAGQTMEQWSDGTVRLYSANGAPPTLSPTGPIPTEVGAKLFDFSSKKLPDMDWISPNTFTGTESINGHACIVFAQNGMKVWIDLQTRTPVQWKKGDETRNFEALPSPTGLLALPADFGKISAAFRHDEALLNRPIP